MSDELKMINDFFQIEEVSSAELIEHKFSSYRILMLNWNELLIKSLYLDYFHSKNSLLFIRYF